MPFFEVSCKLDVNVEDAFQTLAKMIKERFKYSVNKLFFVMKNDINNIYASGVRNGINRERGFNTTINKNTFGMYTICIIL